MDDDLTTGIFLARPERVANGIRLAVKDLFDTAGLTTTYGSAIFADHVPDASAEVVRRLEGSGYANVGKTNLHEFAYGITSTYLGTSGRSRTRPHRAESPCCWSGGSAAALAGGFAEAALGTDSGGSIRIPAACCGVVGFKPSYGLVSLDGCFPLAPSFDHAGPMANTVADCVTLMGHLADGFQPQALESLDELEVGIAWLDRAAPLVGASVADAASLFPRARELDFPLPDGLSPAFMGEVADVHRELFAENADLYGDNVRTKVELCLAVNDAERQRAVRAREEYRERCEEAFDGLDLLLTPTIPFVPPPLPADDLDLREDMIRFTLPFNALGWPVLALPCGPAEDGLPRLNSAGRPRRFVRPRRRSLARGIPRSRDAPGPEPCRRPLCMPFARPCAAFFFAVLALGVFAPAAGAAKPLPAPQGAESLPAAGGRVRGDLQPHVRAHAVVRLGARRPRDVLRGRALHRARTSPTATSSGGGKNSRSHGEDARDLAPDDGGAVDDQARPYALYAHVRDRDERRARSAWTPAFGFNMRPSNAPAKLKRIAPASSAGRRSRVRRATRSGSYERPGEKKRSENLDDHERRQRARVLHLPPELPLGRASSAGASAPCARSTGSFRNGLPATTVGPWSSHVRELQPAEFATGELAHGRNRSPAASSRPPPLRRRTS